jgi:hypothetical protein
MEPGSSLPFPQEPTNCPCLRQIHPVHAFPSYFFNINLRLSSHPYIGLQSCPFLKVDPTNPCMFLSHKCHMYYYSGEEYTS